MNMNLARKQQIENFENIIFVCFARPSDSELPQVADEDETVIELLQESSLRPHDVISAELHHQIDPAYEDQD
jgi:hypothetical protein